MFDSILIANRGEIACRIIRTNRRMGIRSVAVYSEADANAQHVRLSDIAVAIGGSRPAESYLLGDRIIAAALQTGAQAVHPGFGFLSENADFAEAVERAGLVFIGPRASSMRKMGSKAGAKQLMEAAGVPVVPGYQGEDQAPELLAKEAQRIGFPLMIKAAHGGGGKGMRIVRHAAEFQANLESCQREAKNAFGRDRVLLERYIETPRHIEIQIFGDQFGNVVHLNERECSVQRRYQKIIEESPSPFLTPALRAEMGRAAVLAGQSIDYMGAGTVEFIVSADGSFYFMEINTRLQVEHPVTELCLGLDLVEMQLRVANKEPLQYTPRDGIGHAIEVRLYAEDPASGFLPASGKLVHLQFPGAPARIDSGVVAGDVVSVFYDPMIAKLIVHAPDRSQALAALKTALQGTEIGGIKNNIDFLEVLIRHPDFIDARIDTGYLDRALESVYTPAQNVPQAVLIAAVAAQIQRANMALSTDTVDAHSPWNIADDWRVNHDGERKYVFQYGAQKLEVRVLGSELYCPGKTRNTNLFIGLEHFQIADVLVEGSCLSLKVNGVSQRFRVSHWQGAIEVHDGQRRYLLESKPAFAYEASAASKADALRAPMPGRIVSVQTTLGAEVMEGAELMVMEAMKMELSLKAPKAGKVAELRAVVGDFVDADSILIRLE
jgi:3-methylcrotonyl-CoA carboxylase alpha subunit